MRDDSVGFMNFGMNGSFSKFVGILMCANAFFELLIINCHPEFKNGHLSSTMDPTASYTGASEVSLLFTNNHVSSTVTMSVTMCG